MAVPYSINYINVKISEIKHVLSETSYALSDLCGSTAINKWGIHRKYVSGSTAAARLTTISGTTSKQGHFRWYYHPQSAPGFDTNEFGFTDSAGSLNTNYVSLGAYTMSVVTGSDWITIEGIGTVNHTYDTDLEGELVGGIDNNPITYNALIGEVKVSVEANGGTPRTGTVRLTHPDGTDDLTISQGGLIFNVDPLSVSFEWDEIAVKRVTIDVGGGYSWQADFPVAGQPAWLTVTKSGEGTTSGYVDLSVSKNTGSERNVTMRVRKFDGTNLIDTKEVSITQEQAPI